MSIQLFNKGLQAHKSGALTAAAQYYQKFLKVAPKEHNALQLLGVVLHAQGDNESALKYMQASLKIQPDQPQVMLNVASCQRKLGLYDAALKTLNMLIKKDPANFAAFKSRMNVLVEMKNYQQAYKELSRQIRQFPGHYELYNLLGAVASESEDYTKAITAYQKAIQIRPGSDVARHNLGLAYWHSGEPDKALREYQLVLNSGRHSHQLMHNMGNAYADIGHLEQAVTFYNNALKLNYTYLDTHVNLSNVLWEMGNQKHFLRSFQKAISLYPDEPAFLFQYIRKMIRASRFEEACKFLQERQTKFGEMPEYKYLYGLCLLNTGQKSDGLTLVRSLINHSQLVIEDHLNICEKLMMEGDFQSAERALSEIRRVQPDNISALALWGLCLRAKQDKKDVTFNNYTELVREYRLFDPQSDLRFYNSVLETVSKMHAVKDRPIEETLVNGTQTRGHLFKTDNPVLKELVSRVEKCIASYIEKVSPLKYQWLLLPDSCNLQFSSSWSTRLRSGGYHLNHVHPDGKLSALIYLSLPKATGHSQHNEGYLRFGEPEFESDDMFTAQHFVKPEVGKMVLFPSFYWHGTQSVEGDTPRISISCNIV